MKLAVFSPLNPQPTGIADYTEMLLPYLSKHATVDLFVDGFRPANEQIRSTYSWFDYQERPEHLGRLPIYNGVVYQMGNDPRWHGGMHRVMPLAPGVVVLHEVSFQHFFLASSRLHGRADEYFREVEACHGIDARRLAEHHIRVRPDAPPLDPLEFPLLQRMLDGARGVIVHSEWARRYVAAIRPSLPIVRINHPAWPPSAARSESARRRLRIGAFGQVLARKGLEQLLRVLATLAAERDFELVIAGIRNEHYDIDALVAAAGVAARTSITGQLSADDFERAIVDTDIGVNLRDQTFGEASGTLCRLLAAGVPTIVSNVGWSAELPGDAVVKLDAGEQSDAVLRAYLDRLLQDGALRERIGANARQYALTHLSPSASAAAYVDFIREVGVQAHRNVSSTVVAAKEPRATAAAVHSGGRFPAVPGLDYHRGAVEYLRRVDPDEQHYLRTKPFYNLATARVKQIGDGLDPETHRHFCDFANIAYTLRLPAGSRILDVGCGSGWLSEYLGRLGYDVTGIDVSEDLLAMARERVSRVPYGVDARTPLRCRFVAHAIDRPGFYDRFDAVVCYDSLHHVEDERAAIRNMASVLRPNGLLLITEGAVPPAGSTGARELIAVMERFATLESPFDRGYLRELLVANGFSVIGDFVPINGLFDRSMIDHDRLAIDAISVNCLLAKRCQRPDTKTTGEQTGIRELRAQWQLSSKWQPIVRPGAPIDGRVHVRNAGDSIWLADVTQRPGTTTLGLTVLDHRDRIADRTHGQTRLPRPLGPGEGADLSFEYRAPETAGLYKLQLDLVAHNMCWFSDRGSDVLTLPLNVVEG